jgi:hypothetical protein
VLRFAVRAAIRDNSK